MVKQKWQKIEGLIPKYIFISSLVLDTFAFGSDVVVRPFIYSVLFLKGAICKVLASGNHCIIPIERDDSLSHSAVVQECTAQGCTILAKM